jgi:hypothetical protein
VSDVCSEPLAWASHVLRRAGVPVQGAPTVHATRLWSTVWTLPTNAGTFWLKAGRPGDGGVEQALAALVPELVDEPMAAEPARGWLLTRDGGTTMDAYLSTRQEIEPDDVCRMIRDYAMLQRGVLEHRSMLARAGIPITDPARAGDLARAQADYLAGLPEQDPRHLRAVDHKCVLVATSALAAAGQALVAGPLPMGLDHGDLATRNVFMPRSGGRYRFFDFSDARWAHPFESLTMLLWEFVRRWRITMPAGVLDTREPRIRAILNAYLSCWTDFASMDELRPLAAHALRLAPLHRAAVWLRTLADADVEALGEHGRTPWAWLQDVVHPVPV